VDDQTEPIPLRQTLSSESRPQQPCLTVLAGPLMGRVFKLDRDEVTLGRSAGAGIRLQQDGVSREHARVVRDAEGTLTLVDLGSTNGTWVEGRRVQSHVLREGERIQLGATTILKFGVQSELEEDVARRLYESATRDPLTGAYNRRVFDEQLARDISHARRHRNPLSLLVLDVDHFKRVNDEHGHPVGDRVLAGLATLVADSVRHEDVFCRIGGEEFAIIMRDSDAHAATLLGGRLRQLVETQVFGAPATLFVTVSVGVACFAVEYPTPEALLAAADSALYEAKRSGRNRVCVAQ